LSNGQPDIGLPQLLSTTSALQPMVACEHGMLVAAMRDQIGRVAILTDPDILSNAGLHRGDNADLALSIIDQMVPQDGTIVIDETVHGIVASTSIWKLLLTPPLLAPTLLTLAAIVLMVWASAIRLGAPVPTAANAPAGRQALIANAASLLVFGGHGHHVAERFAETTVAEVAEQLHVDAPRNGGDLKGALDAVARRRGLDILLPPSAALEQPVAAARAYHTWKLEMLHGSRPDRRARR
jgi:hypothetical protein